MGLVDVISFCEAPLLKLKKKMSNNEELILPVGDMPENQTTTERERPNFKPTREYLNGLKKIELQKLCRQAGQHSVWKTKEQLVEMLLHAYRAQDSAQEDVNAADPSPDIMNKILKELEDVKEKLAQKDSKIQELSTMLKTTHVTISRLNDRISTLEERILQQSGSSTNSPQIENELTLFLGDNHLNEIRLSDLGENCTVKTIKDTTMDLAGCWVREKLDLIPNKCVIYCGRDDLIESDNINCVFDDLGSLISELKHKNENINIFVCELAPHLKSDVDDRISMYNEKLKDWCSVNGVNCIKVNLSFRLGTGDIDEMCYNREDSVSPLDFNRYGALRLLTVINKQCKYLKLNENTETNQQVGNTSHYHDSRQYGRRGHFRIHKSYEQKKFRQVQRSHYPNSNSYNQRTTSNRSEYQDYPRNDSFSYESRRYANNSSMLDRNQRGCFNCGEYNHRQSNCRYDHQIRCNNCFNYGHKSRRCNFSNY